MWGFRRKALVFLERGKQKPGCCKAGAWLVCELDLKVYLAFGVEDIPADILVERGLGDPQDADENCHDDDAKADGGCHFSKRGGA